MSGGFVIVAEGLVTAANVGAGVGQWFRDKIGAVLNFKTLLGVATEIDVTDNADDVTVGVGSNVPLLDVENDFSNTFNEFNFIRYDQENKTIAVGSITPTSTYTPVDTEGGAGADDLDTIVVPSGIATVFILMRTISGARDVTLKDGVNNLRLAGDFTLTSTHDFILLAQGNSTQWQEVSRSDNL